MAVKHPLGGDGDGGAALGPRAAGGPAAHLAQFLRSPKGTVLVALGLLYARAAPGQGLSRVGLRILVAGAVACALDLLLRWRRRRALPGRHLRKASFPTGALLSGLFVAGVLGPTEPWYVLAATAALAVLSRQLLRTRWGPIFNPAAFGLLVAALVLGAGESWWGALADLPWPWTFMLVAAGAYVADRVNKLPVALSFTGTYFGLFTLVGMLAPSRVVEMFHEPFAQAALFLALFMLTDPPTSPGRPLDQVWYGALVALISVVAQLAGAGQSYLLLGCLVGNLILVCRRSILRGRTTREARSPDAAPAFPSPLRVRDESGQEILRGNV